MTHFAPEKTSPPPQGLPTLVLNEATKNKNRVLPKQQQQKRQKITSVSKDVEYVGLSYTAGGNGNWYNNFGKLAVTTKV